MKSFEEYMIGVGLILLHSHGCEPDDTYMEAYKSDYQNGVSEEDSVKSYFKKLEQEINEIFNPK